jgi:adenosylhomocysteine nucleosidase
MLMIAAAMEEELETAKSLCTELGKVRGEKAKLWKAIKNGKTILFLRTGVGPERSAKRLKEALSAAKPSHILVIGYAGALDPRLRLGDLIAVERAVAFSLDDELPEWENARVDGEFYLTDSQSLLETALSSGIKAYSGNTLTSAYVLGDPVHKRILFERFHASIVDMETAALARIARSESVPLSCIRVVSDEAEDAFLAPFSYNPSLGMHARAKKFFEAGMTELYRKWKINASIASGTLSCFLSHYL